MLLCRSPRCFCESLSRPPVCLSIGRGRGSSSDIRSQCPRGAPAGPRPSVRGCVRAATPAPAPRASVTCRVPVQTPPVRGTRVFIAIVSSAPRLVTEEMEEGAREGSPWLPAPTAVRRQPSCGFHRRFTRCQSALTAPLCRGPGSRGLGAGSCAHPSSPTDGRLLGSRGRGEEVRA